MKVVDSIQIRPISFECKKIYQQPYYYECW